MIPAEAYDEIADALEAEAERQQAKGITQTDDEQRIASTAGDAA